jgi:iron complex transport system ATP-binding protein
VVDLLSVVRGLARNEGKAVLSIFHDLNLASAYCDHIHALASGRVVASGSPSAVLTPGLLRDVFGIEAEVWATGAAGRPQVTITPPFDPGPPHARAHVMGGAGRGGAAMRSLAERGFEVTVGVLHGGDTDEAVAERLNLLRVTVPPFSVIDPRSAADCRDLVGAASLLVVCDAPFGPGNVENLRIALEAVRAGVRTILLEQVPIEERDSTGGEAAMLWRSLRERSVVVGSVEEIDRAVVAGP